ncbi:MAG TPA: zinc-ribbon domain-containing protein [Candidatus Paceibacterota bacterium]|nr:zinc-ribbon domain-containing protein [Candidatus Paceibacterota bacterium]
MNLSQRELQEKIAGAKRVRKMAYIGLALGVAAFLAGLLLQFPLLFIMGYTVFIVCTGIGSFITILNWQYNKALKAQMEKREKPPAESICPRCGMEVDKNERYCPKCGKKIPTRKR